MEEGEGLLGGAEGKVEESLLLLETPSKINVEAWFNDFSWGLSFEGIDGRVILMTGIFEVDLLVRFSLVLLREVREDS